jgi:ribA/ribD-fused uncharacterized protein
LVIRTFDGEYAFLSNFYSAPIAFESVLFPTSEHAYQAQKFVSSDMRVAIASINDPSDVKRFARSFPITPDWEQLRVEVMLNVVRTKFACHRSLGRQLSDTGEELLQEDNTWGDSFWGTVGSHGENWLGRILMHIRAERRRQLA